MFYSIVCPGLQIAIKLIWAGQTLDKGDIKLHITERRELQWHTERNTGDFRYLHVSFKDRDLLFEKRLKLQLEVYATNYHVNFITYPNKSINNIYITIFMI